MRANQEGNRIESAPPRHRVENSDSPAGGLPDHFPTILVLLWLVTLANIAALVPRLGLRDALPPAVATIDPNVAPWYELTVLPRIGEGMAEEIVRYRENTAHVEPVSNRLKTGSTPTPPAFTCPADLTRVRGIGPKTVRRMGPFLRFE